VVLEPGYWKSPLGPAGLVWPGQLYENDRVSGTTTDTARPTAGQAYFPLLIVAAGIVAYHNSLSGVFVFDDHSAIVDNPSIFRLWPPHVPTNTARPLTYYTLAINYAISDLNTWSYHVFNLAIHLVAGLALYGLIRRTLHSEKLQHSYEASAGAIAISAALIWVVHPLTTQSVTYIIQRAESMMGMLFLLALYCVVRGIQSRHAGRWYTCAVLACAAGMGTKEVMATAPVLIFLYDAVFVSSSVKKLLRERWQLYAGLAATWLVLAGFVFLNEDDKVPGAIDSIPWQPLQHALTQPEVILHYLRLSIWPAPLCLDYAWPPSTELNEFLLPAILVGLILLVTVLMLFRRSPLAYASAWFFLILAPTSSIVPTKDLAFEHRMYLPLAAVVTVIVWLFYVLLRYLERKSQTLNRLGPCTAISLVTVSVATLSVLTIMRNQVYHSRVAMWSDVVTHNPDNPRGHNNLGRALGFEGRWEEAAAEFQRALELNPTYVHARSNLGWVLINQGNHEEAIKYCQQALQLRPDWAQAYHHLGVAQVQMGLVERGIASLRKALETEPGNASTHYRLGRALLQRGRYQEATSAFRETLRFKPNHAQACNDLGDTLRRLGDYEEAFTLFEKALHLDPDSAEVHNNLGIALIRKGQTDLAEEHLRTALKINPQFAEAHNNLGSLLLKQGQTESALSQYREAIKIKPDYAQAHLNLADVLWQEGQFAETLEHYQKVLELEPDTHRAHDRVGLVLFNQGQVDPAITHFRQALKLAPDSFGTHCNLGVALASQGNSEEAEAHFRAALRIKPDFEPARKNLERLLQQQGEESSPEEPR